MSQTQFEKTLLELEIARENRRFEIQMFWQRSNYFLALNSALAVGVFAGNNALFTFLISGFGIIASTLWYRTNLGARYWQVYWESEVHKLAKEIGIEAFARTDDEILANASSFGSTTNKTKLRKFVDTQVNNKPSVSYNMILLSMAAIVVWLIIFFAFSVIQIRFFAVFGTLKF